MEYKNIKIGMLSLGPSVHTLGLDIIKRELVYSGFENTFNVTYKDAKDVDFLLISLYWIDQILGLPEFLIKAKINPKNKKPVIIIGGSCALNPYPLKDMFHYMVAGDGEDVTVELIKKLVNKKDIGDMECVLENDKIGEKEIWCNVKKELPIYHYVEDRNNKITRIEISRGCKAKCSFCQLTNIKPYREIPPIVLKNLIATAPTKTIALFSPDRGSYSEYENIEVWCNKYNKHNMGTDIRLQSLRNTNIAQNVRFGIEGFSERERGMIKKSYKNENLINDILHVFDDVKNMKGKSINAITWYMILGLPGQGVNDYEEFNQMLSKIDGKLSREVCIFLTFNDFNPMNHTPAQNWAKDIYTNHMKLYNKTLIKHKYLKIAKHGGSKYPSIRLAHLLACRGGENSNKAVFNIAINSKIKRLLSDNSNESGKILEKILTETGVNIEYIKNGYPNDKMPYNFIKCYSDNPKHYNSLLP